MDRLKAMIDQVWFVLPFSAWACVGFIAYTLQTGWPGIKTWLSQFLVCFLSGACFALLLQDSGLSDFTINGICACIGMSGGKIVEDLPKWIRRRAQKIITGERLPGGPNDTMED